MTSAEPTAPPPFEPPKHQLPPGACDCHAHVFGPFDQFPLAATRSYDPPLTPADDYFAMLDRAGFSRGVLVQPSAYGLDCRAVLDAIARAPERLRGVAVKDPSVSDAELADLHAGGIRALRFAEAARATKRERFLGAVGFDDVAALAPRIAELGWHAKLYGQLDQLLAVLPDLVRLKVPLVIDHFGHVGVNGRRLDGPDVQRLLGYLVDGRIWLKLSAIRNSTQVPDYPDMVAFHQAFLKANPDQVIWGSDWPFINMGERTPQLGHVIDLLEEWTGDAALLKKLLVDNPARLYDF